MHAVAITSFVVALMGTVTAQTSSVVNLHLMGFDGGDDQPPFVGSIIASDATATTYSITCGSTTASAAPTSAYFDDEDDCGIPDSFTFTQGPSTIAYVYTIDYAFDITMIQTASDAAPTGSGHAVGCVISNSSSAYCTGINVESSGTSTISSDASTTVTGTDFSSLLSGIPVTITAGLASTTSSATPTTSGASATGASATGASASGSSKSSTSASSSASGPTASTGGMPMITAKAQWVVGGAAAAMVMAAL
ncbi:predicted protein [Sclerotinia sclerotiorum 1980 UF-70]|uniref:GPI anchored protein n=2 Tax=Sclerotinia sclerotiorum (strain ATCC 18683 / 1980 / Ss-1) TaxID=665079 RepID=A7EQX0_SCLS1|nr:predicted protein [Sclerotinia sclerotiorum 1980 UF-70]APA13618.1 hypothetical protein sscle_11g083880 [Sclerotinia sclerotiorum 1980 UF-70]EDN91862.1 predicted protein [Sclerotinia sclerotiorum 1980 UF-70]